MVRTLLEKWMLKPRRIDDIGSPMFRNILTLSLVASLLISCNKKDKEQKAKDAPKNTETTKDTEPATTPVVAVPPTATLVFKAAKLAIEKGDNNNDGPDSIELDDEGNVIVKGETVLKLAVNGSVTDKAGKVIAKITADGTLSFEGEDQTMVIAEDGTISVDGKTLSTIGEDGVVALSKQSEKVVFEGPKEARRAMMVAFLTVILPDNSAQPSDKNAVSVTAKGELSDLKAGDEGCNITYEGRCFKTDVDACNAGGCNVVDCSIAESMPGKASCPKK